MEPIQANPLPYRLDDAPLLLREYGRNVQYLVNQLKGVNNPERARLMAHEILRVMASISPELEQQTDVKKTVWEHLARLAGYDLPFETPFPIVPPDPEAKPDRVPYYPHTCRYKVYGKNIELLLADVVAMEDEAARTQAALHVASLMKQFIMNLNPGDAPADGLIFEHIDRLTEGKLRLDPAAYTIPKPRFANRNHEAEILRAVAVRRKKKGKTASKNRRKKNRRR